MRMNKDAATRLLDLPNMRGNVKRSRPLYTYIAVARYE